MAMLQVVQYMCRRTNVPVPSTAYGTTDPQVLQMIALLEEEGNDLAMRGGWERLTIEGSFTTVAAEDQGAITTLASNGFRYIKNNTIWDRTTRLPVCGPMTSADWQAMKAFTNTGPRFRFRIRTGKLIVNPAPPASDSWYFEYITKNWITDSTGVTYKNYFTADTDLILLPEELVLMGLRWRWKKEKGLDYAEDFRTYEAQVKDALGRDGGKRNLWMDETPWRGPQPGVWIPDGSWI